MKCSVSVVLLFIVIDIFSNDASGYLYNGGYNGGPGGNGGRTDCHSIQAYTDLNNLIAHDKCWSVNSVFHRLHDVRSRSHHCLTSVIQRLSTHFTSGTTHQCACSGTDVYERYHSSHDNLHDYHDSCQIPSYMRIYNEFFTHNHQGTAPKCRTHHGLWHELQQLTHSEICLGDIIDHLSFRFTKYGDPCHCHYTPTTHAPSPATQAPGTPTQAPETTTPVAISTTPFVTSASMHSGFTCDKSHTILDVAKAVNVQSQLAGPCSLNSTDEALVISECSLPASNSWKRGQNVLADCLSGSPAVPKYAPIATFTSDTYVSAGGYSGIFVGCVTNGFQVIIQNCGSSPTVISVSSDPNASQYHTIV